MGEGRLSEAVAVVTALQNGDDVEAIRIVDACTDRVRLALNLAAIGRSLVRIIEEVCPELSGEVLPILGLEASQEVEV